MSILGERSALRAYRNQHDIDVALFEDIAEHWPVPELWTEAYNVWIRVQERLDPAFAHDSVSS